VDRVLYVPACIQRSLELTAMPYQVVRMTWGTLLRSEWA
jgi:hypothetical protein